MLQHKMAAPLAKTGRRMSLSMVEGRPLQQPQRTDLTQQVERTQRRIGRSNLHGDRHVAVSLVAVVVCGSRRHRHRTWMFVTVVDVPVMAMRDCTRRYIFCMNVMTAATHRQMVQQRQSGDQ